MTADICKNFPKIQEASIKWDQFKLPKTGNPKDLTRIFNALYFPPSQRDQADRCSKDPEQALFRTSRQNPLSSLFLMQIFEIF